MKEGGGPKADQIVLNFFEFRTKSLNFSFFFEGVPKIVIDFFDIG